jgi:GGDEF domain-containing protein
VLGRKEHAAAAAVHLDVVRFDSFADAVGFSHAEEVIRAIARLILDEARAATGGGAFVGHLGGSVFIAVLNIDEARAFADRAAAAFESRRMEIAGSLGAEKAPGLALTVAIAPTEGLGAGDNDELGRRLGQAMRAAKVQACEGGGARSTVVAWTREHEG